MMDPRVGLDLFSAIKAAAEGVARILRHDPSSAVLFWGDPPEVEVVHQNGVPEEVCRALTTAGGRSVAEAVRKARRPVRVLADRLGATGRELRVALRSNDLEALAAFPLLGEAGVVGCLLVPLAEDTVVDTPEDEAWGLACRSLEGLQLVAAAAALEAVLSQPATPGHSSYDGLLVVDRWERVIVADGVFTEIPGWSRADLFGRSLNTLPGGALLSALTPSDNRVAGWVEHVIPPVEGHGIPVSVRAEAFGRGHGASEGGRIVFLRDLRPEVEEEDPTARLLALGMRVAHAADELAGAIPAVVPGDAGLDAAVVERFREKVAHGRDLVRQVLDRCLAGVDRRVVDLNEVVRELLDRYTEELEGERIRIFRFQRPDLPGVRADRLALLRVFRTLLQAARESLGTTGGTLTVRTWTEAGWVHAVVSDDGVGQGGMDGSSAFQPLFAAPSEAQRTARLDEAEELVGAAGGELLVESRPGLWNRLTVRLPEVVAEDAAESGPPEAVRVVETEPGVMEVLVVDDNAALRSVLKRYLERRGHTVTEANDGEEALRIVSGRSFDRVIVDVQMPVKDGPAFYTELEHVAPSLRARTIFMTGGFVHSEVERFIEDSGRPAIKKPFDLSQVVETIEK